MTLDLTKYAPALKSYYSVTSVENMVYKDHPAMAMLTKDSEFYGENLPLPIVYGNPQGRSATFATAKSNKTNSQLGKFTLVRKSDYSLASIDNETAEASENNKGAFLKALTLEIDGAIQAATNSAASDLFGSGTGKIGQIDTTTTIGTAVLILSRAEDVVFFEKGMSLKVSATDGAGAGVRAGKLVVDKVDRIAGELTMTGNLTAGVAAIAVSDYVFVEGDYDKKMPGFAAWLPAVAPTGGDNFYGLDRSSDPTRLAGIRFDGSKLPIEEAFIKGASLCHREGGRPDVVFCSYDRYSDLEASLGSKVQYVTSAAHGRADISFKGIQLNTNKGVMTVIADSYCPNDTAYMLTMKSWKIYSLKKMIRILDLDGNKVLRESDADAVEVRIGGYKTLGCNAPGHNVNIKLG